MFSALIQLLSKIVRDLSPPYVFLYRSINTYLSLSDIASLALMLLRTTRSKTVCAFICDNQV